MTATEIHSVVRSAIGAVRPSVDADVLAHSITEAMRSIDSDVIFALSLLLFGVGLYSIYSGVDTYRKSRLISDTSTEQIRSMAVGRTELEGTAHEIGNPYSQPFVDGDCLYASWQIEEFKHKRRSSSWTTVESGTYTAPFLLEDGTGTVVVDATADATWELTSERTRRWTVSRRSQPSDEIVTFCTHKDISPTSWRRRRYTQTVLPPQASVYVFGESTPRDPRITDKLFDESDLAAVDNQLTIERDDGSGRFIISDMDESGIQTHYSRRAPLKVISGLLFSTAGLYGLLTLLL